MGEINIKIRSRDFYIFFVVVLLLIGVGFVIAWGGNNPSIMGHSFNELDIKFECTTVENSCSGTEVRASGCKADCPSGYTLTGSGYNYYEVESNNHADYQLLGNVFYTRDSAFYNNNPNCVLSNDPRWSGWYRCEYPNSALIYEDTQTANQYVHVFARCCRLTSAQ